MTGLSAILETIRRGELNGIQPQVTVRMIICYLLVINPIQMIIE